MARRLGCLSWELARRGTKPGTMERMDLCPAVGQFGLYIIIVIIIFVTGCSVGKEEFVVGFFKDPNA